MKLRLDFVGRGARLGTHSALLLTLGIVCAAASVQQYVAARRVAAALERELDAASRPARRAADTASIDPQQLRARIVLANHIVRKKTVPWDGLFRDIEQASDRKVGLLSIQPEAAAGQVRISGEALDAAALAAYIMRLEQQASLQNVHLVEHQVRQDHGRPVLRFNLTATWVQAQS